MTAQTTLPSRRGLLLLLAGSCFPFAVSSARAQITGSFPDFHMNGGTDTRTSYSLGAGTSSETGVSSVISYTLWQSGGTLNFGTFDLGTGLSTPSQPINDKGGIFNMGGGIANIGNFNVGAVGNHVGHGYVSHYAGDVNVSGTLRIGRSVATGSYSLNHEGILNAGSIMIGSPGPAYGSSGLYLNGGMLTTSSISNDSGNHARYLGLNGAYLKAGTSDNPDWIARSLVVYMAGEVTFHTNGRNMGIPANMANSDSTGKLTKIGAGTLTLGGSNLYSGPTTVQEGTLSVSAEGQFGAAGNALNIHNSTLRITGTSLADLGAHGFNAASFSGAFDIADASHTFTLAPPLSGSGSLVKAGAGTLVLPSASTRSGLTTIAGGTLRLGDPLALQASALGITSGALGFGPISSASLGRLDGAGSVLLTNTSSGPVGLLIDSGSYEGSVSGSGSITKRGSGTLTLTGSNSHSGGTILSGGTLVLVDPANLGDANGAFTLDGGTLRILGTSLTDFGSRPINGSTFNGSIEIGDAGHTFTLDRALSGSSSLAKLGPGTLVIGAVNSGTGATHLNAGTLSVANSAHLSSGALGFNGGILRLTGNAEHHLGGRTVNGSTFKGGFDLVHPDASLLLDIPLSGSGTLIKRGEGKLVLHSQASETPNFTNSGGALIEGGTLEMVEGNFSGPVVVAAGSTFSVDHSGAESATGLISGAGRFRKKGSSTHVFSAAQTYTGGTTVDAGTLNLGFGGSTGAIRGNLTINEGATVSLTATNAFGLINGQKVDSVTLNHGTLSVPVSAASTTSNQGWGIAYTLNGGTLSSNGGVSTYAANSKFTFGGNPGAPTTVRVTADSLIVGRVHLRVDNGTNTDFTVDSGATLLVGAAVTSGGGDPTTYGQPAGFTKLGGGTMRLEAENPYTGNTIVAGGTLALAHNGALGTVGKVIFTGGTLQFSTSNANDYSARFTNTANQQFRFDTNGRSVNLGTVITSDGGTLVKSGDGALKLSAINTYTGGTTVHGGTLELASGGPSGAIRGNLTLESGTTLLLTATNGLGYAAGQKVNNITVTHGTISVPESASATLDQGWGIAYTLNGATLSSNGGTSSTTAPSKFALGGPAGEPSSIHVTGDSTIAGRIDLRTQHGNLSTDFTVDPGTNLLITAGITSEGNTGTSIFRKLGEGSVTMTGNGIYTGATEVKAGTLQVDGSLGNTHVIVSSGASLAGTGSIGGATTIQEGARLKSGTPVFSNGLALQQGAVIDFEPGSDKLVRVSGGTLAGPTADRIIVNVTGELSNGTFTLIDASGATLSDLSAESFTLGAPIPGYHCSIVQNGSLIQLSTAPVTAYDLWSNAITDPALRGREADADGDGFTNLEEFLFGTSPDRADGSLFTSEALHGALLIRWLQRSEGASYELRENTELSEIWATSELIIADGDPDGVPSGYTKKEVTAHFEQQKRFFRIEATEN